jgi:hypothetical protein
MRLPHRDRRTNFKAEAIASALQMTSGAMPILGDDLEVLPVLKEQFGGKPPGGGR